MSTVRDKDLSLFRMEQPRPPRVDNLSPCRCKGQSDHDDSCRTCAFSFVARSCRDRGEHRCARECNRWGLLLCGRTAADCRFSESRSVRGQRAPVYEAARHVGSQAAIFPNRAPARAAATASGRAEANRRWVSAGSATAGSYDVASGDDRPACAPRGSDAKDRGERASARRAQAVPQGGPDVA